jgi:hypothetical protein
MKKVLLACLSESLTVPVWFAESLGYTFSDAEKEGIELTFAYGGIGVSAKQNLIEGFLERDFDSIFFISPNLQWVPKDLFKLINSEYMVHAVPTVSAFNGPTSSFNVIVKDASEKELTATSIKFDFISIDKKVFTLIEDIVPSISLEDKEGTLSQIPVYFATTLDDYAITDEEDNFAKYLEKAGIDIHLDSETTLFSHYVTPHISQFGASVRSQFIREGFEQFYDPTAVENRQ